MSRKWTIRNPRFQADRICPQMPVWPWAGHRNFAYDLVRFLRPERVAELGVHWGTSFFAFAQAIKDGHIDCELIGVDTFEGDPHAGEYGEEVLETVHRITKTYFSKQRIVIHRSLFRDALDKVEDESCDIIHIDGFHTFEAVNDDFTTWLPKLKPDGVMLFHDTAPDTGYGSADFWSMIADKHPGFAFPHSWGLGVLFPKGSAVLERLRAQGLDDKCMIYQHRAEAEIAGIKVADLSQLARQRMDTINRQSERLAARKAELDKARHDAHQHAADLKRTRQRVQQLSRQLEKARELARQRRDTIEKQAESARNLRQRLESLNNQLESARTMARERFAVIQTQAARHEETVARLRSRIESLHALAAQRADHLHAARSLAQQRYDAIQQQAERIRRRNEHVARLARELDEARQVARDRQQRITILISHATALQMHTDRLERALNESESSIERKQAIIQGLEHHLKERDAMLDELRKQLASLQLDVDLLNVRTEHAENVLATHRREIAALLETRPGKTAAARLAKERTTTVLLDVEDESPQHGTS